MTTPQQYPELSYDAPTGTRVVYVGSELPRDHGLRGRVHGHVIDGMHLTVLLDDPEAGEGGVLTVPCWHLTAETAYDGGE